MMRGDIDDPSRFSDRGKAFRFLLAALALAAVMLPPRAWADSPDAAKDVSSCPVGTVPIQIMPLGRGSSGGNHSIAEIPDSLPHFRAFVTAVTEHVTARLAKDKLCIIHVGGSEEESLRSGKWEEWRARSLLQFVHWEHDMHYEYLVPVITLTGGLPPPSCWISSPWIELVVYREPIPYVTQVPQIRGIVYWNERQLLVDQAALAGAKNVPPGRAMPLTPSEKGYFLGEYLRSGTREASSRKSATKPLEERVPPDMLWLFRHAQPNPDATSSVPLGQIIGGTMFRAREKSAKGYTKLVLALIDRCFDASAPGRVNLHYGNILDVADPVLLKKYKIDPPLR